MALFYAYGWRNPDGQVTCLSRDYRINSVNELIPTAPFDVARAWQNQFKINFTLTGVACTLIMINIGIDHLSKMRPSETFREPVNGKSCRQWLQFLYINLVLVMILFGNLISIIHMLMHHGEETTDCNNTLPKTYKFTLICSVFQFVLGVAVMVKAVLINFSFIKASN